MTIYRTFTIYAGCSFVEPLEFTDDDGNPINLINYTIKGRMAESGYSETFTEFSINIVNYSQGKIEITLTKDQTKELTPGKYVFILIIIDQYGNITPLVDGLIDVIPGIGLSIEDY